MHVLEILGWESLLILSLILVNGLFSLAEISLISSRRTRLQHLSESGDGSAARALDLLARPGKFLATVIIGVNITAMLVGAYGGVAVAARLEEEVRGVAWLADHAQGFSLAVVIALLTYVQIIFGELVPKTLALRHPETFARLVSRPMDLLSRLAAPLVLLLNATSEGLLRLFGSRPSPEAATVTGEEIALMLAQGAREGVFHSSQHEMMESVIEMGERRITALMTPKPDIEWLDSTADLAEMRSLLAAHPYSRFPVCRGSFDNILGVVHAKDLLARFLGGRPLDLEAMARPVPVIPDSVNVLKALEAFRVSGETMAFVSDEYGSVLGLVTLDDVLRNILGSTVANHASDGTDPDAVLHSDGSWLVEGTKPLDEIEELIGDQDAFSREDEENYQTLGGYVMGRLDRIPSEGDVFDSGGWRYEVAAMEGNRVEKVVIRRTGNNG